LQQGRWGEAWEDYQWGRVIGQRENRHKDPEWDGSPLPGKVLYLWAEQGLGDTIMIMRLVERAKVLSQAKRVTLEVHGELLPLLYALSDETLRIVGRGVDSGFHGDWDEHCSLWRLPALLGIDSPEAMRTQPYISAKPIAPPFADGKKRVGICWRGSAGHANDAHRSIPEDRFKELVLDAGAHDCVFVSLVPNSPVPTGIPQQTLPLDTFQHTASILAACDLVITVDTAVAHLAGAMGRPTWLLLAKDSDWRWGAGDGDHPALRGHDAVPAADLWRLAECVGKCWQPPASAGHARRNHNS
jgi:hypothetical protein